MFLASFNILDITNTCEIRASYRSDHSTIELEMKINTFLQGKGLWKFNNSLLECPEYVDLVNGIIVEEKLKYAVPLYNLDFLKNNFTNIEMIIDHDLFLETLLLRIRGETIKFATTQKKKSSKVEKQLISDIEFLEAQDPNYTANSTLLLDKRAELESIRSNKLKGQLVRSRLQWLQDGEKPSKYFSNLEKKHFIEKTIRKVRLNNGEVITDQENILSHVQQYYSNLFENRDDALQSINFENLGIKSSTRIPEEDIGLPVTVDEVGQVLKKMKSNKSPGIDGITVQFVKVFWRQLKYFIINAINCGFSKGCLTTSLRQCIITCLPKAKKDCSLIKNWRPISLLSVIYKLASGTIAERLKKTLNYVISDCQTGFIKGRYISESTRLIYDLLHAAENKNMPGMLMLIDFEKAFDSLSWSFLYSVLKFFGYSENFIKWVKLFNTEITTYIVQCGFLSRPIKINRGCRQGDPISAYLFLIGAEILARLIQINPDIIGLKIKNIKFKITQFADDTTLILNGSQHSLQLALNTLEVFGNLSGLKMNKEKTKVIWIGRKKFSKDKLNITIDLEWGCTNFTLLGIEFSTNLSIITERNYTKALEKKKVGKDMEQQIFDTFGQDYGHQD